MSNAFGDFGVQPDQGPPLAVPLVFFVVASLAIIAGGVLMLAHPNLFAWRGLPWTIALVHLGTLGFLGSVMLGALYQMQAVVAAPVPLARLGHIVALLLALGASLLVSGFLAQEPLHFKIAWHSLALAIVFFLGPILVSLARATTRTTTVFGILLATTGLGTVVTMGIFMSRTYAGASFSGDWLGWIYGHLAIGAIVWIGGLITSVSWQVVPMFYLTNAYPRWSRLAVLLSILLTGVAVIATLATEQPSPYILYAALPGALAVWILHPLLTLSLLRSRRRKRIDDSMHFWQAGLACGPLIIAFLLMTWHSDHPRWPILLGWTTIWGWAGLIIHGMLSRIVPFLVWFHRYSGLVGKTPVPPMRQLWPKRHLRASMQLHIATLALGLLAIATTSAIITTIAGIGLMLTGVSVFFGLTRVAWHMRGR